MKELLSQLAITVNEGRHIFEYEAIQLDWWDKEHPINYEIELIFGEDATILLFYFVPHIEGLVERSLILVAETKTKEGTLIDSLLAEEVKNEVFPEIDLNYDDDEGGYHLESIQQASQAIAHFMAQLSKSATVIHSALPEADQGGQAEFNHNDYDDGAILSHFISMYFMNNEAIETASIISYLQFAKEMEGAEYIAAVQQDAQLVASSASEELQQQIIAEQEELVKDAQALKTFVQAIQQFEG